MTKQEFQSKDKELIFEMWKKFYETDAVLHKAPIENFEPLYQDLLAPNSLVKGHLFLEQEVVIGYALLSESYATEVAGKMVIIEEIYIKDEFRGKGYGKQVLALLIQEYQKYVKRIRLEVVDGNDIARKMYINRGFQVLQYEQLVLDIK